MKFVVRRNCLGNHSHQLRLRPVAIGLALLLCATACNAHFLWLASDGVDAETLPADTSPLMFFGESAVERSYHLPENLTKVKIVHRSTAKDGSPVEMSVVDEDEFVGMRSNARVASKGVIETSCTYGLYHGSLLTYYAKSYLSDKPTDWLAAGNSKDQRLEIIPTVTDGNKTISLQVLWEGKPVSDASASIVTPELAAEKKKTDKAGVASFETVPGLVGFLVSVKQDESGTFEGEDYKSAMYFATLTLRFGDAPQRDLKKKDKQRAELEQAASVLPVLPKPIASFGAVASDGWVYVYGGHTGRAHAHSRENLVDQFVRISCDDPNDWETLPMQTPVQGVPLVAHDGNVYRLGGLVAKNAPSESDDLHSLSEASRFNTKTNQWESITPLPHGRSSHDAVVIGDNVYVVGGWTLTGDDNGEWLDSMLVADLSQEKISWQAVAQPFERRALAVGNYQGKVAVVGGLDTYGDIDRSLNVYDPSTKTWSKGPSLPGEGMNGFGVSAWSLSGQMFVSGSDGNVYQLDGDHWDVAAKLQEPRFFHQLVPESNTSLFAIGGANDGGHIRSTERIVLKTVR